jgi:hypothetical protein
MRNTATVACKVTQEECFGPELTQMIAHIPHVSIHRKQHLLEELPEARIQR